MLVKYRGIAIEKSTTVESLLVVVAFCVLFSNSVAPNANATFIPLQNAKQKKQTKQQPPPNTSSDTLPKLEDMLENIPTQRQLLEERFDWVVKLNDDVIVCEPVKMRPDTLTRIPQEVAKLRAQRKLKGPDLVDAIDDLEDISIVPIGEEESIEFLIDYRRVKQIIYHEDLLLKRIEIMQDEGNLEDSWQLLFDLKRRVPNWPGVDKVFNRFTLYESRKLNREKSNALALKSNALALTFLEDLFQRDNAFSGLATELGVSCEALISDAVNRQQYRKSRYFLDRLIAMLPEHPVAKKWRKTLSGLAEARMNQAIAAFDSKQYSVAVNHIEEAAEIWPGHPRVKIEYSRIKNRYQSLRVGVVNFPARNTKFPVPTLADDRLKYLTQSSIFEAERVDDYIHYGTPFFEKWIPSDLGRRLVFKIDRNHAYWQSRATLSANEIAATIKARIDPTHPEYDERLESYVKSVTVVSPDEFRLLFKRNPPRLEALLDIPVIDPLIAMESANVSEEEKTDLPVRKNLLSKRFQPAEAERWSQNEAVYTRFRPEPDGVNQYHVGEVYERKYPSYDKAKQALVRGEVDLLPHIQSWDVIPFRNNENFEVVQYALPLTHSLQFNPRSKTMQNREMRRALEFGIDRDGILRRWVLVDYGKKTERGRIVTAPYASSSYAYNSSVSPRKYDPILAMALSITAKSGYLAKIAAKNKTLQENGIKKLLPVKIPVIKMIVDPDPIAQRAARAIVQSWKKSKIDVQIVPISDTLPDDWDIVYRVSKMTDPVVDLWLFLTMENRPRVQSLENVPDWIRHQLIQLEYARSWNDAVNILHTIHDQLSRKAFTIPLWEVDDYMVYRKGILGPLKRPLFTYQGIESWRVPAKLSD